jgi:rhamnose utilization protein RhaD (predicted bifunctional aldolase and dehydrogenase)/NAD(P)-dependent dehydrogenase (short-subunit alcohol dehydrogenase family)
VISRWDDAAARAAEASGPLGLRVYTSRLLGAEPSLVLHGGGNTSVKLRERDLFRTEHDVLWVKGSGWDLATIEPAGFAPVKIRVLEALARLDALSDVEMARQLRLATMAPEAPAPSVEAILHGILPFAYVDHTHADAIISLTNTPDPAGTVRAALGDRVPILPYVMPGFDLSKAVARLIDGVELSNVEGIVLLHHGLFTFAHDARSSYERMVTLVGRAEDALKSRGAWFVDVAGDGADTGVDLVAVADLRFALSRVAGAPMLLASDDDATMSAYARDPRSVEIATRGPATPDHVLRTKRVPLVGRDVAAYAATYEAYVTAHRGRSRAPIKPLDAAPRVVLDRDLGALYAGRSARDLRVVRDIARHTARIVLRAERMGGWRALPEADVFDVEYWSLEQAKLGGSKSAAPLQGEVAFVTGAASGIGLACVDVLREHGAAVVGVDRDPAVTQVRGGPDYLGVVADVTDPSALDAAVAAAVRAYGGIDVVVPNAGVFAIGDSLHALDAKTWRLAMTVNADATLWTLQATYEPLKRAPRGGRVVIMGSRNALAPGPGAAAYSASKAAATQLARSAALEWANDGIRVNVVHPDGVFDTGLWANGVLEARAAKYGLTVDQYKRRNLLRCEIVGRDVAELVAVMAGPTFRATTGAQVPIDGGNDRVV